LIVARWALDEDAMLAVPDAPGFGIALNMDAVEKYTSERFHPHRRELLYPSIN
jgi:L-alanine-DL-glutamate epimerase-like enolase superfamily enzyme